ncbi:MAG: hypothetical protein F4X87_09470 [Chloroflexi bacterium]|nr:hypothetical protein [Chloroflexota bacterium]
MAQEERGARARDAVRRGHDPDLRRVGAAGVDPDEAVPGEPRAAGRGRRPVPAEHVGGRADPGADAEARAVSPPAGRGSRAPARSRSGELLALHLLAARRPEARRGRGAIRTRRGARSPGEPGYHIPAVPGGHNTMRPPTIVVALTFLLAAVPTAAQQHKTARQHEAAEPDAAFLRVPASGENGQDRIHSVRARVRHTTVIVLPATERILDFVAGDSEYWHLTGAANVAYLKPLAEDAATNIALVCESGRIYSFLVSEHGDEPPHLIVRVEAGAEAAGMSRAGAPAFVARSEVAAYREMAAEAADAARRAQAVADAEIEAFRASYPTRLAFEYRLDRDAGRRPFLVEAMWHDGQFTYLRSHAQEAPALYELRDGEPALVAFDLGRDGLYVARHVLDDGWLQIGEKRAGWRFEPGDAR